MSTLTVESKQLIEEYLNALSGRPKTEELLDRYISDESLKEHILQSEVAFPGYELVPLHLVAEGDLVALHGTFRGVHKGPFAGIEPTGRQVSSDAMVFYRIRDGVIVEHWLQMDMKDIIDQLTQ